MELFSELYGCYYAVVGRILHKAHESSISRADVQALVEQGAFSESVLHLLPRLLDGDWNLLSPDGEGGFRSVLRHANTETPITTLQKSWLKTLLADARMRLFLSDAQWQQVADWLCDVPPLWMPDAIHTFDCARDGDPYEDAQYRANFSALLAAIHQRTVLHLYYAKGKGGFLQMHFLPTQLQYSAKGDKFRVIGREIRPDGRANPYLFNVGRITGATPSPLKAPAWVQPGEVPRRNLRTSEVLLYIWPERNALERCMTQFAFYEKETWADPDGPGHFCRLTYHTDDESELLIRILSFGPVLRVLAPEAFVQLMRERIERQVQLMDSSR